MEAGDLQVRLINRIMEDTSTLENAGQGGHSLTLAFPWEDGPLGRLIYRKDAIRFLGVSRQTINKYEHRGLLTPIKNRINGRVYYTEENVLGVLGSRLPQTLEVVCYCRAAVLGSKGEAGTGARDRLARQVERVHEYCVRAGIRVDRTIQDVGPGHTLKGRPGIDQLFELVLRKKVSTVVVETPDRLARFAAHEALERFFMWHNVKLHVISPVFQREEYREELKGDLAGILFESKKLLGE